MYHLNAVLRRSAAGSVVSLLAVVAFYIVFGGVAVVTLFGAQAG